MDSTYKALLFHRRPPHQDMKARREKDCPSTKAKEKGNKKYALARDVHIHVVTSL